MLDTDIVGLLIATLGGTAVGLERQWSGHADGPSARLGGLRTFTMLGAIAGLSGWLWKADFPAASVVILAGAVLIIAAAYAAASRQDVDATTEVAALVVLSAGVLAGIGHFRLASAIIALESLLLVEKSRLHALVRRIDETGLRAGVRFAVMALVILPLLPAGPYGPLGVRPREIWALVLFFSGLSFLGFVARRVAGPHRGYVLAGALGGVMSSTSVTLTFARASRLNQQAERGLAFGAVAANAVLYPRVIVATAALNRAIVAPVAAYLVLPALVAAGIAFFGVRRAAPESSGEEIDRNPLQLRAALQMAVLFQLVLVAIDLVRRWGPSGILLSASVLGLTDVDALTMSMARQNPSSVPASVASMAIATGIAANTAMKLALAIALGSPRFKLIAGSALAVMFVAGVAAIVLLRG